jgi:hypothetical protein
MGCSFSWLISSITSRVKALGAHAHQHGRLEVADGLQEVLARLGRAGIQLLGFGQVGTGMLDQAVDVEQGHLLAGFGFAQAQGLQFGAEQLGNARPAEPAPRNITRWSVSLPPVMFMPAAIPASATLAVP